jgi:hypothetical protein
VGAFASAVAGVIVGALLSVSAWVFAARREVRVHDARIDEVSDLLALRAGTSIALMLGDVQAFTDDANARNAIGGAVVRGEQVIRRRAGDSFEEHFIRTRSERAQIAASEDFRHAFWRRVGRRRAHELDLEHNAVTSLRAERTDAPPADAT